MDKQLLIAIFFIFTFISVGAQSLDFTEINGLKQTYQKTSSLSDKADLLNQLGYEFRKLGLRDSALDYTHRAQLLTDKLNYAKGKIATALNYAIIYRELKMYPEAIFHTKMVIDLADSENDLIRKGDAFDNLAHIHFEKNEFPLALKNHFASLRLREKMEDNYGIGNSCDNIAYVFSSQNRYQDALKYFMRSQNIFKKMGDLSRETLSTANVGLQLYLQGNYPSSLSCFYSALENYKLLNNDEGISWMYRCIGEVLEDSGNIEKAIEYYYSSLALEQSLNNHLNIAEIYSLIGKAFIASAAYEKALEYEYKSLKLSEATHSQEGIVKAYYYIAETQLLMGNLDLASKNSNTAISIAEEYKIDYYKARLSRQIGEINLRLENPKVAKTWLNKAIDMHEKMQTGINLSTEYKLLSEAEAKTGNFEKAFKYQQISSEFYNRLDTQKAANMAMLYEADKKETLIKTQQQQKDLLNSQELKRRQIERNAAIAGLILMFLLAFAVLYVFRLRSKKIKIERQNLILKRREAEAIQEKEQFKSRYIANISHEFRTLLTLIRGHIEILGLELERGSSKPLEEINLNGDRLLELVNQLLDMSKLENGKYSLICEDGQIIEKIKGYIYSFETYARKKELKFEVLFSERAIEQLENRLWNFSSEALQIIISNLLSNAVKFTPVGGEINTYIDFKDETLIFSISDSGIGIDEKDTERIFDRFYQANTSLTTAQKGSGIGLSLVKELSVLHQGDVTVKNNEEKGCCFTVHLKCNPVVSREAEEDNQSLYLGEKPLILIVEDQPDLRRFIANNIGDEYESIQASDGEEGICLAEKHLPDLIISDVLMPKITGLELCRHLKNTDSTSHIPIILLSGFTEQNDKIKGMEIGAVAYLPKPFSVAELRLTIRNVVTIIKDIQGKFKQGLIPKEEEITGLSKRDFELIKKLRLTIEENIENTQLNVGILADIACLSQSQLTRKLKTIIGQTPSDLIKTTRLTKALELLEEKRSISETAWAVGFEDSQYFSKVFKKHFGVIPSEYYKVKQFQN